MTISVTLVRTLDWIMRSLPDDAADAMTLTLLGGGDPQWCRSYDQVKNSLEVCRQHGADGSEWFRPDVIAVLWVIMDARQRERGLSAPGAEAVIEAQCAIARTEEEQPYFKLLPWHDFVGAIDIGPVGTQ